MDSKISYIISLFSFLIYYVSDNVMAADRILGDFHKLAVRIQDSGQMRIELTDRMVARTGKSCTLCQGCPTYEKNNALKAGTPKVRLIMSLLFRVLLYGAEIWTIKAKDQTRTDAFQM